ncbi:MAG: LptF/LptG family permease [Thermoguttaceae bacterium]
MNIFTRYIFTELLKSFLIAAVLLTSVLIVGGVVQVVMVKGVTIVHMVRLIPFVFVEMSRVSIPMTLLLATTTFFARMAGNNEIVALKSVGIPPWKILWPVVVVGFAVSLLSVWLNDLAVTWGRAGMTQVIFAGMEDTILNELKTKGSYEFSEGVDMTIRVQGIDYKRLVSPLIVLRNPPTTISAESAEIHIDTQQEELRLVLNNFVIEVGNTARYEGEHDEYRLSLARYLSDDSDRKRPSLIGMSHLPGEMDQEDRTIASKRRQMAAMVAFGLVRGKVDALASPELAAATQTIHASEERKSRLAVETPRRWAAGFSCLAFVWVGAPLAIWMRKSDIFASFFACFIPILLLYYPLMELGKGWAKEGTLPPSSVWLGNVVLLGIGCWFLKRIHRY